MTLGWQISAFLVFLFLIALSRQSTDLKSEAPLDDDRLLLPTLGYGSSTISLSGLFGAYTAALLLLGTAALIGILLGVVIGLLMLGRAMHTAASSRKGKQASFQSHLYQIHVFGDSTLEIIFWLMLVIAQILFVLSELSLLHLVFTSGVGMTASQAIAAVLAVSLVCYLYCLMAGYKAVFRTDVFQYVMLVAMGAVLLYFFFRSNPGGIGLSELRPERFRRILEVTTTGSYYLSLPASLRHLMELFLGVTLGAIPVLGAPDNWKRVFMLRQKKSLGRTFFPLLVAGAVPIALALPLLLSLAPESGPELFPIEVLLATRSRLLESVLLLGIIAAFTSTFDSATVSSAHLLLKLRIPIARSKQTELQRYQIILAGLFLIVSTAFYFGVREFTHAYVFGFGALGLTAVAVGIFTGTFAGTRTIQRPTVLLIAITLSLSFWGMIMSRYVINVEQYPTPVLAMIPVGVGAMTFLLFSFLAFATSKRRQEGLVK